MKKIKKMFTFLFTIGAGVKYWFSLDPIAFTIIVAYYALGIFGILLGIYALLFMC